MSPNSIISSLAWAELYITLATIARHFDFEFQDIQASDFEMESDDFIIVTKNKALLNCDVNLPEA